MTAKEDFIEMFDNLPDRAKVELVVDAYGSNPMTLAVIAMEVRHNTTLGERILQKLGYSK